MRYILAQNEIIVLKEFLLESRDHLEGIEDKILKLEVSRDIELINSIFRPIHTIKGSSSFLSLEHISRLSHEVETLLDDLRKGRIREIDSEIIDILLEAIDTISRMLANTAAAVELAESKNNRGGDAAPGEPLDTEIAEVSYEDILDKVIAARDKKGGEHPRPAASTPGAQGTEGSEGPEGEPKDTETGSGEPPQEETAIDYAQIKYPGDMRLQYEVECDEQITTLENLLLELEKSPQQIHFYNDLFRALHSLKGNTGVILSVIDNDRIRRGHFLNYFKEIAHILETIVQKKRDSKQVFKEEEIELLLNAADCMKSLLLGFKNNHEPQADTCHILERLRDMSTVATRDIFTAEGGIKEIGGDALAEAISNSLEQGMEAIEKGLNEITGPDTRETALKKLKRAYTNLNKIGRRINHELLINLSTSSLNLVEFMAGTNEADPNEALFIQSLEEDFKTLREKADRRKNKEQLDRRKATIPPPTLDKELESRIGEKVLKVSQEKIDIFMNLIGELLVSKNALHAFEREVSRKYDLPEVSQRLKETADTIARISNDLQTHIMEIRMLPVAHAFSKFPRMVRDLSKKLQKKIRLEVSGEDTEIDKNIIETIADPLVHMMRNSVDHGIEPPEERLAAGKPEEGVIQLAAFNQGQYVVIRIIDDGRGMDPYKIRNKALERALLPPEELEQMDDRQLFSLIFLPGFSMAGQISDVSGRGVGMDVVKTNIEKLSGEIQVESTPGKGSTFTIKLPLTMAIGRGLEVEAHGSRYYVPLDSIIETLRIPADSLFQYKGKHMTVIREELIPVHFLARRLGLDGLNGFGETGGSETQKTAKRKQALVILNVKGQKLGLLVDNYYNECEYVIKPLSGGLSDIEGISGAMITGAGTVHLILDPMRLFN